MTRAVEVAPGVFVAPGDYTGPVEFVKRDLKNPNPGSVIVTAKNKLKVQGVAATSDKVAAKLWPGEGATGDRARLEALLNEAHALTNVLFPGASRGSCRDDVMFWFSAIEAAFERALKQETP
jgi:hypothetical protein